MMRINLEPAIFFSLKLCYLQTLFCHFRKIFKIFSGQLMDDCLRKRNDVTFVGDISLEITHCVKEERIKSFSVRCFTHCTGVSIVDLH